VRRLLLLAVVVLLAGCGGTVNERDSDLVARGDAVATAPPDPAAAAGRGRGLRLATARIAIVTHGQASDPFWAIVKRGADDAARRTGAAVSYRAPDTYDIAQMRRYIEEAIGDRLDGLVVSLPDVDALASPIARAERAGVPVVSINSGSDQFRSLGILAHVGQPEWRAGFASGQRMARVGVRNAVCVNQEVGNAGLDARCRAFDAGLRAFGGRSRTLAVDLQEPARTQRLIAATLSSGEVDGILTLGTAGAVPALAALRASGQAGRVPLATFDLSPDVLEAVRDDDMLFAVDQQPYLQGYLPIVLLAERASHDLFPPPGELIPTGPEFVTAANAARALELSRRGFR
jgi:simple sugar transport system substrate-binding protein